MGAWKWVFKSIKLNDGGYNASTGAIHHPPKGKGKSPKIKVKRVRTDKPK